MQRILQYNQHLVVNFWSVLNRFNVEENEEKVFHGNRL